MSGGRPFRVAVHALSDGRVKVIPCDSIDSAVAVCNRNFLYSSASLVSIERLNAFSGRYEPLVTADSMLDSDQVLALNRAPKAGRRLTQVIFDV